jgi:UDP-N-acetylglucosamine:LPS N-acetylglucosamine transferase
MSRTDRPRRVLAMASGGGHWIQLQRLRPAFADCDVAFVSVYDDYADDVAGHRFYKVSDITRMSLTRLFVLVPQLIGVLLRERPKVVITTGSAPGLVCIALARTLFGAKTIWIDSIANCERMSTSGSQARRFAHQWLTQWPELSGPDGPGYWGAVL